MLPTLERPQARADPGLFGAALVAAAQVSLFVDLAQTRRLVEQAVELGRELHDERLVIDALGMLCGGCFFFGEPDRGLALGLEAVERARQLGDDVLLGQSLMICLMFSGRIEPARFGRLLAEAIACTERSGDQLIRYALLNNLGADALIAGDVPAARAHLEQADHIGRAIRVEGLHVENLGWVRRADGDPTARGPCSRRACG